jgi:hypothetical protein
MLAKNPVPATLSQYWFDHWMSSFCFEKNQKEIFHKMKCGRERKMWKSSKTEMMWKENKSVEIFYKLFTFTRPPQCLSCRGHFYYRIIPCQY